MPGSLPSSIFAVVVGKMPVPSAQMRLKSRFAFAAQAARRSLRFPQQASAAAAKARAPRTSWVPGRLPCSWPPPKAWGRKGHLMRSAKAPIPTGPPILCAAIETPSTSPISSGIRPNACTASVCMRAPAWCAIFAISATGWITPVSLFADMTETKAHSRVIALATASGSILPSRPGRTKVTSNPRSRSAGTTSSSESCSMAEMTTCVRRRSRARAPSAIP